MDPRKNLNDIKCVMPQINLPLFMVSRNRIKYTKLNELKRHIKKNYVSDKNDDGDFEKVTPQHLQQDTGISVPNLKVSRIQIKSNPQQLKNAWQLPPNLYNTSKIPYENKRGIGGAHWQRDHTHQPKHQPESRQPHGSFYSLPRISERIFTPCNRSKGVFLTNARERSATARCMISNVGGSDKNPNDPGPATYNPTYKKIILTENLKVPNPHLFNRASVVPTKTNSIHKSHTSFTGAPGRYETRYRNTCLCSSSLKYQPEIDLLIEKEKRKKFRRLPYDRIKVQHYTSPDWRHVKGRGFPYLFVAEKPKTPKPLAEQELKRQKNIQLYPDSKYIGMINNPARTPLSVRTSPILNLLPRIKFNCTAKKVARKQLRNNKKIAFNSGQERFQDSYRLPVLTLKQQEKLKQTLPRDRQFRDHPIINRRMSEIKSRLDQTPKHMLPNYVPKLRKKNFKFQPLPQPKVLVTENDTNVKELSKDGYYFSLLEAKKFFTESAKF